MQPVGRPFSSTSIHRPHRWRSNSWTRRAPALIRDVAVTVPGVSITNAALDSRSRDFDDGKHSIADFLAQPRCLHATGNGAIMAIPKQARCH